MKKLCFVLVFMGVCFTLFSQTFSLGGGIGVTSGFKYRSDISMINDKSFTSSNFGINIKSLFNVGNDYHVSLHYCYLIPASMKMTEERVIKTTTLSSSMIDIDGHYNFLKRESFRTYVLAGFDIHLVGFKYVDKSPSLDDNSYVIFDNVSHDNYMGLNVGAGISGNLSPQFGYYFEAKCLASHHTQLVINSGFLYYF